MIKSHLDLKGYMIQYRSREGDQGVSQLDFQDVCLKSSWLTP